MTELPLGPTVSVNVLGVRTAKTLAVLVIPWDVVTPMRPVVAPCGTTAVTPPPASTVKLAGVPLNATAVVAANPFPVMVTLCPGGPLIGWKVTIVGGTVGLGVGLGRAVGVTVLSGAGDGVRDGLAVGVGMAGQPLNALSTPRTSSATLTSPSLLVSKAEQAVSGA